MDYSDDAFHTFMDLDSAIYYAVNGTVTSLPVFIQNILNCVPKTNEAFTSLERRGGKWLMTIFFSGRSIPLKGMLLISVCYLYKRHLGDRNLADL